MRLHGTYARVLDACHVILSDGHGHDVLIVGPADAHDNCVELSVETT